MVNDERFFVYKINSAFKQVNSYIPNKKKESICRCKNCCGFGKISSNKKSFRCNEKNIYIKKNDYACELFKQINESND